MPEFASIADVMSNCTIRPKKENKPEKEVSEVVTEKPSSPSVSNVVISSQPPVDPSKLVLSGRSLLNVSNTTWFGILCVLIVLNLILSFIIVFRLK